MPDNMPDKIETLRALASRLAGKGHVRARGQGDWEYFQYQEDADDGGKWSDIHFDDAASYLAALDPATVLKLLDRVEALEWIWREVDGEEFIFKEDRTPARDAETIRRIWGKCHAALTALQEGENNGTA